MQLNLLGRGVRLGDDDCMRELLHRMQPIIMLKIRPHRWRAEVDDLKSIAAWGIYEACLRFDSAKGSFFSYMILWFHGSMLNYIRDYAHIIRLPRAIVWEQKAHDLDIKELRTIQPEHEDLNDKSVADRWVVEPQIVSSPDVEETLRQYKPLTFRDSFHERKWKVLEMTLVDNMSQREIAEVIGCSQMHVSRIYRSGVKELVDDMKQATPDDAILRPARLIA